MITDSTDSNKMLRALPFSGEISGAIQVGGDKSISHRAVILAALAIGTSQLEGLSKSADVEATIRIMRQLGVAIQWRENICVVEGLGLDGLTAPDNVLDCGNSGTTARLMLGVLTSHKLSACLTGDESLRRRPMHHLMAPLQQMGAQFVGARAELPLILEAHPLMSLTPITFEMQTASAQLKSALILAGLNIAGQTVIIEKRQTRDHTERMLKGFNAPATIEALGEGRKITISGQKELEACDMRVPRDPSSAAFLAGLAAISEKAELTLEHVAVNPHRIGFYQTLKKMGAAVEIEPIAEASPIDEPIANIKISGGNKLSAVDIPAAQAVSMIDEYPILSIIAAHAEGATHMRGLSQLRVKESDRLAVIADNLNRNNVQAEIRGNDLTIIGRGGRPKGGGSVNTHRDHRIAMAFLVLGAAAEQPITIDHPQMIKTSFPDFEHHMRALGITIEAA